MNKALSMVKNNKKKGFTLVELLVVIVVIGILFVAFISRIDFATDKARETGVKSDFRSYQTALEQVFREEAGYKVGTTDGTKLMDKLNACLDSKLKLTASDETTGTVTATDPWGTVYTIKHGKIAGGGANDGYVLIKSLGPNATNEAETITAAEGKVTLALADGSDDYALLTSWRKGELKTTTVGFSQNIE